MVGNIHRGLHNSSHRFFYPLSGDATQLIFPVINLLI